MKKQFLSIMLTMAMVLSLIPSMAITASADGEIKVGDIVFDKVLPSSGGVVTNSEVISVLAVGNYYLDKDLTLTGNIVLGAMNYGESADFNICLNGHKLTMGNYSIAVCNYANVKIYGQADGSEEVKHYYNVNNNEVTLTDSVSENYLSGGVITGATNHAIIIKSSKNTIIDNVNFVDNYSTEVGVDIFASLDSVSESITSSGYGGAICGYSAFGSANIPVSINNCKFIGNKADKEGGAIFLNVADCKINGCTFKYNSANGCGGAIASGSYFCSQHGDSSGTTISRDKLEIKNTIITENSASEFGGGLAMSSFFKGCNIASCFAEGTGVLTADGTYKNIEDINEGDVIKTFDHNTGKLCNQEVFYAFEGDDYSKSFTLNFSNNKKISVVDIHDFFEKESMQYVKISKANAKNYIGKHFYNAVDNRYEELLSVEYNNDSVKYYSLYTKYDFNCIAEGMLTVPDDVDCHLRIFKFNDDLTVNQEQLQKDIEKYGLYAYDPYDVWTEEEYDYQEGKYFNIMIGKGLITIEEAHALYDSMSPKPLKMMALSAKDIDVSDYEKSYNDVIIDNNTEIYNNKGKNNASDNVGFAYKKAYIDQYNSSNNYSNDYILKDFCGIDFDGTDSINKEEETSKIYRLNVYHKGDITTNGDGGMESECRVTLCEPIFNNSVDSGYYADKIDGETKEGIIAFTSLFSNLLTDFDGYTFGENNKFGMYIYKTSDTQKEDPIEITSTDFETLKDSGKGYFYSFATEIKEEDFEKSVIVAPFAFIGRKIYMGEFMTDSVANDGTKWLGDVSNKPNAAKKEAK